MCRRTPVEVAHNESPFSNQARAGQILNLPVAHGEGCYIADEHTLDMLEAEGRVVLRYRDNPNGSLRNIAGVLNKDRNVLGMMPHPERAADPLLGATDGLVLLRSLLSSTASSPVLAASASHEHYA